MGKCGWKNEDGKKKMRITKKVRRKKTRNVDGNKKNNKIIKQTIKERKSFFQVAVTWLNPSLTYSDANS